MPEGWGKKVGLAAAVLVGLFLIWWVVTALQIWWPGYKQQKAFERYQAALEEPYKQDTHGGKTPEETWSLFLDALKKEDIELASKYFVVEKQNDMKNKFKEAINANRLQKAIDVYSIGIIKEELPLHNSSSELYYYIPIKNKQTKVQAHPVVFYFNSYTKIWKISLL